MLLRIIQIIRNKKDRKRENRDSAVNGRLAL